MKTLLMMTVVAGVGYSQDSGLKARELFYTPPPDASQTKKIAPPARKPSTAVPVANVANTPLGMRYSVMKRDAGGKFAEVDADSTFRSGDRIRLNVDTNTTGYLYVVMQGSSGNWSLLFPSSDVEGGNNRIEKGSSQQIPPGDKGQFVFNDQLGTEKLFLVLTRRPEPDLDKLIYSINGSSGAGSERTLMAKATVGNDVVNRLRDEVKSRDLVNPSRANDAMLVVDVALKHK
jgi:hypothetical protein